MQQKNTRLSPNTHLKDMTQSNLLFGVAYTVARVGVTCKVLHRKAQR